MASALQVAASAAVAQAAVVSSTRRQPALTSAFSGRSLVYRASVQGLKSRSVVCPRATLDEENSASKIVEDLKEKWDAIDDKTSVAIYGAGALVTIWFSSTIVSAVNSVPLLPKLLELIGTFYSAWFVYRYLLFKESRKELGELVEDLKGKVTGKN